jgi:hypothetical protein
MKTTTRATLIVGALLGAVALAATSAMAEDKKLGELLDEGYTIQAVTTIDEDMAKRMAGSDSWKDDLMITMQRGSEVAFCHFVLGITTTGDGFKDGTCRIMK